MQVTIDGRLREEADYLLFHLLTELMNPIYIDLVDVHLFFLISRLNG